MDCRGADCLLPDGWRQANAEDGTPYHFNPETGESLWEHPWTGSAAEIREEKDKAKRKQHYGRKAPRGKRARGPGSWRQTERRQGRRRRKAPSEATRREKGSRAQTRAGAQRKEKDARISRRTAVLAAVIGSLKYRNVNSTGDDPGDRDSTAIEGDMDDSYDNDTPLSQPPPPPPPPPPREI